MPLADAANLESDSLLEALPPVQSLALLALDTRLAGIVRNSHEPLLAHMRTAWWRERLRVDAAV